jgi:hypothetical protein
MIAAPTGDGAPIVARAHGIDHPSITVLKRHPDR